MKTQKRIVIWAIALIISIGFTVIEYNNNKPKPKKEGINAYVSSEFASKNEGIEKNFNSSSLGKKYSLKVSNNVKQEGSQFKITTNFDEISSNNYEVIGKTPLIVIMKQNEEVIKCYLEKGLLMSSEEVEIDHDDKIEINFKKLMEAVVENKDWSEFGGENKKIKIFYPELTSTEGKLFKEFLLITANGGIYPTQEQERETSEKLVEKFLKSSSVKGVKVITRLTGVNDIGSDIYITFENNAMQLDEEKYEKEIYVAYPTETVEKQVFFESNSEVGDETQKLLNKNNGFLGLNASIETLICYENYYRYSEHLEVSNRGICGYVNFKDAYNPIDIPCN